MAIFHEAQPAPEPNNQLFHYYEPQNTNVESGLVLNRMGERLNATFLNVEGKLKTADAFIEPFAKNVGFKFNYKTDYLFVELLL